MEGNKLSGQQDYLLVQAWLAGDKEVGNRLINSSYSKVLKQVAFRVKAWFPGLQEYIEDVTQEAFSRAFDKIEQYNGSALFSTWVCGFIKYCLNEKQRENKKNTDLGNRIVEKVFPVSEEYEDPEETLINKEECEVVRESFLSLSLEHQEIIYLRLILGMPYKEISAELGKSVDSLESLFRRAIKALRKTFSDKYL